jgi:hypothetical protein
VREAVEQSAGDGRRPPGHILLYAHGGLNTVKSLVHYFLDDDTEQNDNVGLVYRKSLLYLVSRAFQDKSEVVPLVGMQNHWRGQTHARVTSFNTRDNPDRTGSRTHGGFDHDLPTMNQILKVILKGNPERPFAKTDLEGY